MPPDASPVERADFERRSQMSLFFGGTPLTDVAAVDRPPVVMPEAPMPGPKPVASRKRKRKEGC